MSQSQGSGNATVDVSLDENTGPERTAVLDISTAGGKQDSVEIRQEACSCNHQLLKDVLTYRTNWKDWKTVLQNVDCEISSDGLVLKIKRFVQNSSLLISNIENPSNTALCAVFSNWKIKIEGISKLYTDGVITPYAHGTYGGPQYTAYGLSFGPKADGYGVYIQNYPWELGIGGGALKDPNRGANTYGYTNDGVKNVFNISSFAVMSTMGTAYQMALMINSAPKALNSIAGWVLYNAGAWENNNQISTTKRYGDAFVTGQNRCFMVTPGSFTAFKVKISGMQEGDVLQWIANGAQVDSRDIIQDGIYDVTYDTERGGSQGFYLRGNPEVETKVKVTLYDGKLDEDGMIDISDSPVVLTILPTNTSIPLWRQECWEYVDSKEQTYPKAKTVENCLMKYYNGSICYNPNFNVYDGTAADPENNLGLLGAINIDTTDMSFDEYDTMEEVVPEFPDLSEITDLDDYCPQTLKVRTKGVTAGNQWADWINSLENQILYYYVKGVTEDYVGYTNYLWRILSGWEIDNDSQHEVVLKIELDNAPEGASFISLDNLLYDHHAILSPYGSGKDAALTANVKVQVSSASGARRVSTLQRAFLSYVGNLEFENSDGNGVRYISPQELDATFNWSQIPEVDLSAFNLSSRLRHMNYAFENATETTKVIGTETVRFDKREGVTQNAEYNENSWPVGLNQNGNDRPQFVQVFNGCVKLAEIGPVLDVHLIPDPASAYLAFNGCHVLATLKLKGINNFNWDLTELKSLSQESIQYLIENAEDQVGIPYDAQYARADNVPASTTDGALYDYVHIRSSRSVDGLKILAPEEWRSKLTPTLIQTANAKGWHVYIGDEEITY